MKVNMLTGSDVLISGQVVIDQNIINVDCVKVTPDMTQKQREEALLKTARGYTDDIVLTRPNSPFWQFENVDKYKRCLDGFNQANNEGDL